MHIDTPRPSPAARAFMLKAFSRDLRDQGFTAVAAEAILKKRYPWLEGPAPVALATAQAPAQLPTAWERIEAIAKRMVQTGEARTLAQAVDLTCQQLPHLYREYEAERR
jgi:hypothetical protein